MGGAPLSHAEYETMIGKEIGVSDWVQIDQARINAFADITIDPQYIHVDSEAAKASPFGGTIAHGFLTLSLLSAMAQNTLPTIDDTKTNVNFGFNSVRFIAPVRSGKRVRGRFVLKAVGMRSPGVVQSTFTVTVEIEQEPKPALAAEWLTLAYL
jgi:acyl dehydratase